MTVSHIGELTVNETDDCEFDGETFEDRAKRDVWKEARGKDSES